MNNQPKGLWYLSIGQAVAVLGNGLLQSLLILYLTQSFHLHSHYAYQLNAASYTMMGIASLACGYVASRTCYVKALFGGEILRVFAYILLAIGTLSSLKWSLAFFAIGQGFSFTVYLVLVGKLYSKKDKRRYTGFTISYLLMNISFIVSMAAGGYLVRYFGFHDTFLVAAFFIFISLLIYLAGLRYINKDNSSIMNLSRVASLRSKKATTGSRKMAGFLLRKEPALQQWFVLAAFSIIGIPVAYLLFKYLNVMNILSYVALVFVVLLWVYIAMKREKSSERQSLFVFLILAFFIVIWNGMYYLQTSLLTIFTEHNVNRMIFGHLVPPSSFSSVNAVYTILISLTLVLVWHKLSQKNKSISIPAKFSFALIMMGVGWLLLTPVIYTAGAGKINVIWIFITYLPQVLAGSILYPIGNALVGRLSPPHMEGPLMATWQLLGQGMGAFLSGKLALLAVIPEGQVATSMTNPVYAKAFALIGVLGFAAAILCVVSRSLINRVLV